jgi:hypothetical protein
MPIENYRRVHATHPVSRGHLSSLSLLSLLPPLLVLASGCGDPSSPGTAANGGECPNLSCGEGTVEQDGACVAVDPGDSLSCGEGTIEKEGSCVPAYSELECGAQTVELNGFCVVDSNIGGCGPGTVLRGNTCVDADLQFMALPFPAGKQVTISQGNFSNTSHSGTARYAVDFPVPEGTVAVAARSGVVLRVKEDSNTNCNNESCAASANYVVIDHGDGTRAYYLHLKQNGALVQVGDVVCKGQTIALTGNTGWTLGPHLHIQVNDVFEESLPIVFDELPAPGAPVPGGVYTSANAAPASCNVMIPNSSCRADTFQHIGVTLNPGVPCARAAYGQSYTVSGKSQIPSSKIYVAKLLTATNTWSVSCVNAAANGLFSTQVSWSAATSPVYSQLIIGAADPNCNPYQGWSASVRVDLY